MALCTLCPRICSAERKGKKLGFCGVGEEVSVSKAYLHLWEEPCISGSRGSGTVFFDGCSLGCIYCQNCIISRGEFGKTLSVDSLANVFLKLQKKNAHNINLVTPTHFALKIKEAIILSKEKGLSIPVIYNTGGYERKETIKMMEDSVDVYLPDFKYMDSNVAKKYSNAFNYPQYAALALEEMVRQKPKVIFDENGLIKSGVIVRHLLLPGNLKNSKAVLQYVYQTYGDSVYISIMNQYTPIRKFAEFPELSETTSRREYEKLVDYAVSLGIKNAYVQDSDSSNTAYIPEFDMEGI